MAPKSKYLKPASVDLSLSVMNPARIYKGIEVVSIARYNMIKSAADDIKHIPKVDASINK